MSERQNTAAAETSAQIEAKAAEFFQRRRFARWTDADQAQLETWLDESTLHRVTFLRLETHATHIERLADLRPPRLSRAPRMPGLRVLVPVFAAAAALSLLAYFGLSAAEYYFQPSDRVYSTEIGGRATLSFADKTEMELNTNTVVRYRMTTSERTVWLERGEAYFRVAHDAEHPFTVIAGNHRVTDLGTEFLVRRSADELKVALVKGRAELETEGARPQVAMLSPGDEAVATQSSLTFAKKTPQELAEELAWQRGILIFHHTRLADAVGEFNRYYRTKIVIDDPEVARMPIGGEFRIDNVDEFLRTMQVVLKVQIGHAGGDILISREASETKKAARAKRSL